jgi:aspartyl-tRNA(Asn)/glutamyl-tRNA(Gln) amidotransferase subunit B
MEKGQMRLEANISLRSKEMEEENELPSYKVEVKNINSFKFMEKAVKAEIIRQREILDSGQTPEQENRGFKEGKKGTVSQRSKEEAKDYRYFPEPDIPPMEFDDKYIESLKKKMPELPGSLKKSLINEFKISESTVKVLVDNLGNDYVKKFRDLISAGIEASKAANLLVNRIELRDLPVKSIIDKIKDLSQDGKHADLDGIISKVIQNNHKAVEDYRKGKETSLQFLIGAVMREAGIRLDIETVKNLIVEKISKIN